MDATVKHTKALREILETLLSPLSWSLVEEISRDWELVKFVPQQRGIEVLVTSSNKKESALHLPAGVNAPRFIVLKADDGLWVGNGYLYAGPEFAFFQGNVGEELGETLRMVQVLRPLFHALKLSDIEGALEAMAGFKGEETRSHGPYVLAWSGNPEESAFLWKGSIFGDHLLDGAFLTGKEVVLRYPRVKVTLEGKFSKKKRTLFRMTKLNFVWQGEEASFVGGLSEGYLPCDVIWNRQPGTYLIRKGAEAILREDLSLRKDPLFSKVHRNWLLTPKMRAFLEVLAEAQDPLGTLGDEDFFRQVSLHLLSSF
jgi:hypothetical protein